jgi:hypothetical protein
LQEWNKNKIKLWQENVFKINVEQTVNNVGFYLYLHPLGIWPKKPSQETSNLHVAHVHPFATICISCPSMSELIVNCELTINELEMNWNLTLS